MSETPSSLLLSVVIPTCNRPESLALCLARLAPGAQHLSSERYEVIVSDDSTGSKSAEAMLGERFPWVRWFDGPRKGPAANRNGGAKQAQAPWLVFTDDDCVPDDNWLWGFAEAIERDTETNTVWEGKTTCREGPLIGPLQEAPINLTGGGLWSCNFCLRCILFESLGGFDETFSIAYMEDVEFHDRLRQRGETIVFVPGAVVDHPIKYYDIHTHFGRHAESEAIYWYKQGNRGALHGVFLVNLLRNRVFWIFRSHGRVAPFRDRLIACGIALREIAYALTHLRQWEARYKNPD